MEEGNPSVNVKPSTTTQLPWMSSFEFPTNLTFPRSWARIVIGFPCSPERVTFNLRSVQSRATMMIVSPGRA